MAKIDIKHPFPGKSAGECYQTILQIVDKAGYKVFKKRDIAWLVICDGKLQGKDVNLTLSVPFGSPTSVLLTLSCNDLAEAELTAEAERIFGLLGNLR
jgi:hypothetical protein